MGEEGKGGVEVASEFLDKAIFFQNPVSDC